MGILQAIPLISQTYPSIVLVNSFSMQSQGRILNKSRAVELSFVFVTLGNNLEIDDQVSCILVTIIILVVQALTFSNTYCACPQSKAWMSNLQTSDNTAMIIKWAVRIGIIVFDDKKIISSLKLVFCKSMKWKKNLQLSCNNKLFKE